MIRLTLREAKRRGIGLEPPTKRQKRSGRAKVSTSSEEAFQRLCVEHGLPEPEPEFPFAAPERKWRWDWAWQEHRLALEISGGAFTGGRHVRGVGYTKDMEKWTHGAIMGWRIVHVSPKDVKTGRVFELLKRAFR